MNNHCERFETQLSSWLDDELERPQQLELLDHLVRCPSCRDFTIDARSLEGWVATVRPPRGAAEPSPDLWHNIERSVATASTASTTTTGPGSAWWAGLRAAAVLILSVGLGVLFMGGPQPVVPGAAGQEIRLGENPNGMDDSRFIELTTEVLRADPRYQAALYDVMEQVVRDSGAREASTEFFRFDDAADDPLIGETLNRNPV